MKPAVLPIVVSLAVFQMVSAAPDPAAPSSQPQPQPSSPAPHAKAVQAALVKVDKEIKPEHYALVEVDLDEDGRKDALALMNSQSTYSGTGGSTLFLLRACKEDGKYTKVGSVGVVHAPIYLRTTRHHGLRDLLVTVSGGGAEPGVAVLAFDGKCYPKSPGEAAAKVEEKDKVLFAEKSEADGS
ncbi:hypothetical protein [Verrucomicrobium sp. BvORR106]|uniref:hypothetical protein n=1 Tax=Verrucomicrobium sp. BvORR106 TaxID=1403819 RepID=UPI00056DB2F3|nr:hypothetical protein [Verrucomicrobium sp. BvORR106]